MLAILILHTHTHTHTTADLHYGSICSLVAHEDEFSDISQKNLIEKVRRHSHTGWEIYDNNSPSPDG